MFPTCNSLYDFNVNLYLKFRFFSNKTTMFSFHLEDDKALIIYTEASVLLGRRTCTLYPDPSVFYKAIIKGF